MVTIGALPVCRSTLINPAASSSLSARRFSHGVTPSLLSRPFANNTVSVLASHMACRSLIQTMAFVVLVA